MPLTVSFLCQVTGAHDDLQAAVAWLETGLSFDVDSRVHVFELTIRALGVFLALYPYTLLYQPSREALGAR